jgi:hypothetical protein
MWLCSTNNGVISEVVKPETGKSLNDRDPTVTTRQMKIEFSKFHYTELLQLTDGGLTKLQESHPGSR